MFDFPQASENRFSSGSEILPCEQMPERAYFRNIPLILRLIVDIITDRCYQDVRRHLERLSSEIRDNWVVTSEICHRHF
ncbi:hypothetical protein BpHYR1_050331 [Brachionus plicatilis]|uniref:Uncharacterized protein n=1 Tax=Brachionus plicatilis TaxID=10195 RepID=A0A3M7SCN3_BRAPC|nr:hypothetical protein BpHYR1_050331 [Brachionus plicatilis]